MTVAQLPSLELIESMHSFPGPFVFKVIGNMRDDFVSDAIRSVHDILGSNTIVSHSFKMSSGGNHIAVTLSVHVSSAVIVHNIYTKLLEINGLRALF